MILRQATGSASSAKPPGGRGISSGSCVGYLQIGDGAPLSHTIRSKYAILRSPCALAIQHCPDSAPSPAKVQGKHVHLIHLIHAQATEHYRNSKSIRTGKEPLLSEDPSSKIQFASEGPPNALSVPFVPFEPANANRLQNIIICE